MEPPLSAQSELMSAPQKTADKQTSQLLQDQRQTISLLISEKTSLSEALQRYEATDQGMMRVARCPQYLSIDFLRIAE